MWTVRRGGAEWEWLEDERMQGVGGWLVVDVQGAGNVHYAEIR